MEILAALCGVAVVAVGIRGLPRPLAEILIDALHRRAHRALVAYRRELETLRAAHRPEYSEEAS